jgi:hypothetical protein
MRLVAFACTYVTDTIGTTEDRHQGQGGHDDEGGKERGGLLHLAFAYSFLKSGWRECMFCTIVRRSYYYKSLL